MHRGRRYPQVLDRQLSPDATPPEWAPMQVRAKWEFWDATFNVILGDVTMDLVIRNYTPLELGWTGQFTAVSLLYTCSFVQVLYTTQPGYRWAFEYTDPFGLGARYLYENITPAAVGGKFGLGWGLTDGIQSPISSYQPLIVTGRRLVDPTFSCIGYP